MAIRLMMICAVLLAGCGGDDSSGGDCPEGTQRQGSACLPLLNSCPEPAEIPVLGGGCRQIGVTACATGLFESDGEGGCEPILPDHSCPPGTMEVLGSTECRLLGVTTCADGFESDGEGGCDAILATGPCPPGSIARLGHTDCRPLGDCGSGTWGNIVDDGVTVYVSATADATGADGTSQAPFATIGTALGVVQANGQLAVAAGEYVERLVISKPVRLTGRCAELVTIRGTFFLGEPRQPVSIRAGATGSVVRGVTLTGPAEGLLVEEAEQVTVEDVAVVDTASYGVVVSQRGEASLNRVKIVGATGTGVLSVGSTVYLSESVIRDGAAESDGELGRGVSVWCSSSGACGGLGITKSVVSGNRDMAVYILGVDTEITASVVRDTEARASDGLSGRGIQVECDQAVSTCGSLAVVGSVVSGNREVGLLLLGAQTTVTDSVVRDTLPNERDQEYGWGLGAKCDTTGLACGSLSVTRSIVAGNRDEGLLSEGVDVTVSDSVVRDTQVAAYNGSNGIGIDVACGADGSACADLTVTSSLVSGNSTVGIYARGGDLTITDSVVRDTLPGAGNEYGRGVSAECDVPAAACGRLEVARAVVAGNREIGLFSQVAQTEIRETVVRDTVPEQSDLTYGIGIEVQCAEQLAACGEVSVVSSYISGNSDAGILAVSVNATIVDTVVRGTLAQEGDGMFGRGISAQCDPRLSFCGALEVDGCLIAQNTDVGIFTTVSEARIADTVIRGTLPNETGMSGRGISVQCSSTGVCGSVLVTDSLVRDSFNAGIYLAGVSATLEGVSVVDVGSDEAGEFRGQYGQGIWAMCDERFVACSSLQMTGCVLITTHNAGVALQGVSGSIRASVIRQVDPQPLDDKYGYGIQIEGLEGAELPTFHINDCDIRDATLAGVLYFRARGTLSRTLVSGAENSVIMNEGSEPDILDDNDLSGTVEDAPTWANLYPSPAPPPTLPVDF
ncbi:MAG: right-handed parallel beta-helix repeat-containing protein [bacterium]